MTYGETFPRVAWLASEDNPDRKNREAYARLADQEYIPPPPPEDDPNAADPTIDVPPVSGGSPSSLVPLALAKTVQYRGGRKCWYASKPPCGTCQGLATCYAKGRVVNVRDCTNCLREMS